MVKWTVPLIKAGDITEKILDPVLKQPTETEALKRIISLACKCVKMRGKHSPSMDKVTTALKRRLEQLISNRNTLERLRRT
ncbi:hypothetical protein Bca4012_039254 [Brassica carinata]|uniref:non-specific serine/threonine protein kinase n=1 Tax=Brassica carinata TaxID=52824 RepID=A0A8X7W917_BRACI|nr:hypothetical protein Bca52824_007468 [Brassica carinata]